MKKLFKNGLMILAAGALVTSCADYNVTDDFTAQPDPDVIESPYGDLEAVKSYIDKEKYPNMSLGATVNIKDFNKQDLIHAAAISNFDNVTLGNTLMAGKIVNNKGIMNFLDMIDFVSHAKTIGCEIYGSPLFANANQADGWLNYLTSPIEVPAVETEGKAEDYSAPGATIPASAIEKGKASIVDYEGGKALQIGTNANVRILEGFDVDPRANYKIVFRVKVDAGKNATFTVNFAGKKIDGNLSDGKWTFVGGEWRELTAEGRCAEDATEGFFTIENTRSSVIYVKDVHMSYFPDNHRPQTEKEKNDTIHFAVKKWCDSFMETNAGLIKTFDLIDEAINSKAEIEDGKYYDLKHSTDKIFWQDALGSEYYGSEVSKAAISAYEKHGGKASDLTFFIAETGLEDQKKLESLNYWIDVWTKNGAKIDGINAKLNLIYSENEAKQAENKATIDQLLKNLAATGKLIRLSNFDIKYQNAEGGNVSAKDITDEQRQKLADYNAYVIKAYMNTISPDKQAGICKSNLQDSSDPVGLWAVHPKTKDWVRTATYKAFCDALSGK